MRMQNHAGPLPCAPGASFYCWLGGAPWGAPLVGGCPAPGSASLSTRAPSSVFLCLLPPVSFKDTVVGLRAHPKSEMTSSPGILNYIGEDPLC